MHWRKPAVAALAAQTILLTAATTLRAEGLTVEDVVRLHQVTAVRLSPAGDSIAYLKTVPRTLYEDADGRPWQELHVVGLDGRSRPYVTGQIEITSAAWSADGQALYFVAKRDPEATFTSLHRIAVDGGEAAEVLAHVNSINSIHPSPDGATVAFLAADAPPPKQTELAEKGFRALVYEESQPYVQVWLLDVASGDVTRHEHDGSASALAWSPDGRRYAVALAPTPLIDDSFTARDVYVADARSGDVEGRLNSIGKLGRFAWSPDGRRIAYVGSVDEHDPRDGRLYVSGRDGAGRSDLLPDYPGHVHGLAWLDDETIRYAAGRGVWSEVSTVAAATPRAPGPAPAGGPIIRSLDGHPGRALLAAVADTPEHPPEVYVSEDGEDWRRLTDSNPWLAERTLARQEPVRYRARDGLELEALVVHPLQRRRGERTPLILFVHGGPEAHDSNGWLSVYSKPAQALAAQGYTIAYPNYRGSTGRGVEFSKMGQNDYADEEFNDILDLKHHLVDAGLVDADRVGISGASYGGYATMWAASAMTDEFAAAVAFVGISNQVSKFGTGDIPMEMYLVHSRVWPWEDWMWMLERSPVFHAGKTRTPLLIMAGDKDPRVHPGQSLEMYRNVKLRTDTPVRMVFYPDEVHGNRNTAARYDYSLRLQRWMNHYLKGPGGEPPAHEIDHAAKLEAAANDDD